jgi:hypothetical protein
VITPRPTLVNEENADRFRTSNPSPLAPGGSGPHDPGVEARVAKLEADVGNIQANVAEIKSILGRLAPRIDEMFGKQQATATKEDIANLRIEIEKRPTRRQSIADVIVFVGLVGSILAIASHLAR